MDKEKKILLSAVKIFLKYGFHGTTIETIAVDAGVSKAGVHYYFRTKKKLYIAALDHICQLIDKENQGNSDFIWFFITELRNNREMLISHLNKLEEGQCLHSIYSYILKYGNRFLTDINENELI